MVAPRHISRRQERPWRSTKADAIAEGVKAGVPMAAINVRCLEDVDLSRLTLTPIGGRSL